MVAVAFAWHLSTTISEPLSDLSKRPDDGSGRRTRCRLRALRNPAGCFFNYMAQAIENTMERKNSFMAAAHELRAPLASMRLS